MDLYNFYIHLHLNVYHIIIVKIINVEYQILYERVGINFYLPDVHINILSKL